MKEIYICIPKEYIEKLRKNDQRAKARAFMEYYFDLENNFLNSLRFYAKSWNVALGTAQRWVKEFDEEIDKDMNLYYTQDILI